MGYDRGVYTWYTDIYKTTRSGQENKHVEKREYKESVCCDQDGFGLYEMCGFFWFGLQVK